ncbi:MAG: ion channel protein [Bacteroidetes bacterium]|jgi:tetratricopeptide (TPR) repeat protein|nr:ion channel protein [Bacteroidota bacterium]
MKQKPDTILTSILRLLPAPGKTGSFLSVFLLFAFSLFADNSDLSKSAAKAYEKGEYKNSISDYEKIVGSGETSAALYYNLANAYYKNNELGKAIYNYELAHKLNPADEDVKHNLTIANKRKKDTIEQKENYFAKNIEAGVLNLFSTTGWAWITICTLAFSLLLFAGFRLSISVGVRRIFFWLGSFSLVACVVAFIIGFLALNAVTRQTQAIVLASEVQVLNSPTANAKSQFVLHEGTKVEILVTNDEWTSVLLENGNEGWVPTKDIGVF